MSGGGVGETGVEKVVQRARRNSGERGRMLYEKKNLAEGPYIQDNGNL